MKSCSKKKACLVDSHPLLKLQWIMRNKIAGSFSFIIQITLTIVTPFFLNDIVNKWRLFVTLLLIMYIYFISSHIPCSNDVQVQIFLRSLQVYELYCIIFSITLRQGQDMSCHILNIFSSHVVKFGRLFYFTCPTFYFCSHIGSRLNIQAFVE